MINQETFIARPTTTEQVKALKAFMTALSINFEVSSDSDDSPYDPIFVAKIEKSKRQMDKGEVVSIDLDDIWPG